MSVLRIAIHVACCLRQLIAGRPERVAFHLRGILRELPRRRRGRC